MLWPIFVRLLSESNAIIIIIIIPIRRQNFTLFVREETGGDGFVMVEALSKI